MDQSIARGGKRLRNPRETAGLASWLTFSYTLTLFKRGYRRPLEERDLYEVVRRCRSKELGDQLERHWQKELQRERPSILRALWSWYWGRYLLLGVLHLSMRTLFLFVTPHALAKLISFYTPGQTGLSRADAYYYAGIVIAFKGINYIYSHNFLMVMIELGIIARTAVSSLLFRKALKLRESALDEVSVGRITTLITKDIDALEMSIEYANALWIAVVQTAIISLLVYSRVGLAAFSGIGFFLLILPLNCGIAWLGYFFRLKSSLKTDERLKSTKETLSAIKIIKMYTWETFFNNKIAQTRKSELKILYRLFYTKIAVFVIANLTSNVAFFLVIMTCVWLGVDITAELVYFIMSCFAHLEGVLCYAVPQGVSYISEMAAAFARINKVLLADEVDNAVPKTHEAALVPKIVLENVSSPILRNASISIELGLNVVTGFVGSGKTMFLKTLLRDVAFQGELKMYGRISYASQEPWLFPSTIKQNILFGAKWDERRYDEVLRVCALKYDLKNLENGDETIVGERGINLSKGQQARINLARAVYKDSDIYLLDDCLSALDALVSDYIFSECLQKYLKNCLIVFVTHNKQHIERADNVYIIDNKLITSMNQKKQGNATPVAETILSTEEDEIVGEAKCTARAVEHESVFYETKKTGKVAADTYFAYIRYGGGYIVFGIIMVFFFVSQFTVNYSEKIISKWVTLEQNISDLNKHNLTQLHHLERRSELLILFTFLTVISSILTVIRIFTLFNFAQKAAVNLHTAMMAKVINAKMAFFDSYFIGNILNRFSKDLLTMDEFLPPGLTECIIVVFLIGGGIVLLTTVDGIFLLKSLIFFAFAYCLRRFAQPLVRNLQRINSSSRSPMIGHINSTLEGLTTIRAFQAQAIIKDEFDRHQDLFTSANHSLTISETAISLFMEFMGTLFISSIIFRFLFFPIDSSVGDVGMVIMQAFTIVNFVQSAVHNFIGLENKMACVERLIEFTELDQEEHRGTELENWPKRNAITFNNVSLKYNEASEHRILKNISFSIGSRQKIGVVGRTGAGKSSIISVLFRLYDFDGEIRIDDIDIKTLSLGFLRSKISIIPQDPIIFSGTIRTNLDPLGRRSDADVWRAIEAVKLKGVVGDLQQEVQYTSNFSAGQRQLLCLARALIAENGIVVLDEATANMDKETDFTIRQIIDDKFAHCTVIVIAHRLISIVNCHKVMVIDNGAIVEFDNPAKLLNNDKTVFHKMIKQF